ncbi:MAG: hypothetical protein COA94_00690 [Rickettsiales bacterium]|nr:MAG: hypothetical protein COA94_00690 [Rickettsiales bacterium]
MFGIEVGVDMAIVVVFLLINLGVGLYYGQGVKNIKDYALGGRNFSTATLTATVIASWIGGDNFSLYLSESYTEGLYYILSSFAALGSFLIIGYVYAPRMGEFLGDLSIAESMGKLYGKHARLMTSLVGFILIITMVSLQFKIASTLLSHLFGVSGVYTTIASGVIVILYSSLGGVKSVNFTDIVQFFTFGTIIPVIALIVWSGVDDTETILHTIENNPLFDINLLLDYNTPRFWSFLTLMLLFLIPGFGPSTFQRMSMSRDTQQMRKSFIYAAVAVMTVQLLISWISILILSKEPNLDSANLFAYILEEYSYTGLKGIFIVGVLTMSMSTADSHLNSGAVMFSYDIANTLNLIKKGQELLVSRISTVVIGSIALFLAIKFDNLFDLFIFGYSFYMPVVTAPFTLAVLGFRTTSRSALAGMISGFLVALGWMFLDTEVDSVIPGLLANIVVMFLYHYLFKQPGGWTKKHSAKTTCSMKQCFKNYLCKIKEFDVLAYCKQNLPKNESLYIVFAVFAIVSIFSTSYSIPTEIRNQYPSLIHGLYFSTLVVAVSFLTFPMYLKPLCSKNVLSILWAFGLFYILVFVVGLLVIISNFGQLQLMMFILSIMVLSLLTRWQMALFLMVTGVISAIQFFKYYAGVENFTSDFGSLEFKVTYVMLLIGSILIAFFKPKQEHLEQTEHKVGTLETEATTKDGKITILNKEVGHYSERVSDQAKEIERLGATAQKILNNVNHELRLPVGNVMNFAEMLRDGLGKFSDEQLKMISEEVYTNSNRLSSMILNMLDLATLNAKKIELKKEKVNFSKLVHERLQNCRDIYAQDKKALKFHLNVEDDLMVFADINYIRQMIDNLVINAINFSEKGTIAISVDREKYFVSFAIRDEGKGIPKTEIYDIFTPFKMGSNTESKAEGRGVGLALCKSVIEAHGGEISAESRPIGALFRVFLPYGEVKEGK